MYLKDRDKLQGYSRPYLSVEKRYNNSYRWGQIFKFMCFIGLFLVFAISTIFSVGSWLSIDDLILNNGITNEVGINQTMKFEVKVNSNGAPYATNATVGLQVYSSGTNIFNFTQQSQMLYPNNIYTFTFSGTNNFSSQEYTARAVVRYNQTDLNDSIYRDATFKVVFVTPGALNNAHEDAAADEVVTFLQNMNNTGNITSNTTSRVWVYYGSGPDSIDRSTADSEAVPNQSNKNLELLWSVPSTFIDCHHAVSSNYSVFSDFKCGTADFSVTGKNLELNISVLEVSTSCISGYCGSGLSEDELAPGDAIGGAIDIRSWAPHYNTTIHEIKAWIKDSGGGQVGGYLHPSNLTFNSSGDAYTNNIINGHGKRCPSDLTISQLPSHPFTFQGTVPTDISLTGSYKVVFAADYGIPRASLGGNPWNIQQEYSFTLVKANVTSFSTQNEVTWGAQQQIVTTVRNIGPGTISLAGVTVHILNATGTSVKNFSGVAENLASGSTQTFSFSWNVSNDLPLGIYSANATVNFGQAGSATLSTPFKVVYLSTASENITANPIAPYETSTIGIPVQNQGPTNATMDSIGLTIQTSPVQDLGVIGNTTVVNQSTYVFNFSYQFQPASFANGSYPLKINQSYGEISYYITPRNITLLSVGMKSFDVPSSGSNATAFNVGVILTNIGSSYVNVTLNLTANDTIFQNLTWVNVANNSNTTVNFNVTLQNGSYNMRVTANYSGLPTIIEKTDNITIYVLGPELGISSSDIIASPSNPSPGQNVTINATIHNAGPANTSEFVVELKIDGTSTKNNTVSVASASTNTTQFTWENPQAGAHNITIAVDNSNQVTGEDETNNSASIIITVTAVSVAGVAGGGAGGGISPEIVVIEGINDWEPADVGKWFEYMGLVSVTFVDAPKEMSGTLISIGEYPAPEEEDLRAILNQPIQSIDDIISTSEANQMEYSGEQHIDTATLDIYEVAAKKVFRKFSSANTLFISRGDLPVDSMGAIAYAKTKNAPILITKPKEIPSVVITTVERLQPSKIIVVGGEAAVSENVVGELKAIANVERIGGKSRYETAVKVAEKIENPETIVITDGDNPNILAAIVASKYRAPLLYVKSSGIPDITKEYLSAHKITKFNKAMRVIALGVSKPVVEEIRELMKTEKWGAKVEVFVVNKLSQGIFIDLWVDQSEKVKWLQKDALVNYGTFDLSTGQHTLKLSWLDPDIEKTQEKVVIVDLGPGESITKTLSVP